MSSELFVKTGTMGTPASQDEIRIWVKASGHFCGVRGYHSRKSIEIVYEN